MVDVIETLEDHYAEQNDVYVMGNLLLYYVEGNCCIHTSPSVSWSTAFPSACLRDYYLLWLEASRPTW